jgi:hypothetical protein
VDSSHKQPEFVPGLELAGSFFDNEVKPILMSHYPDLLYSAGLIGSGSDVVGFDDQMSTDHAWGPRVMLFLGPEDFEAEKDSIREVLSQELPVTYLGYSTNFSEPDPDSSQILQAVDSRPINHGVRTHTIDGFFANYMNIDISKNLHPVDWLALPHHKLRAITSGRVFHDDIGLNDILARFSWYPHDVWLFILASTWKRIGQEEHLMGRAGYVGDENGSAIIGSRIARDIMRLAFLMEKEYPPYAKWFGTAFSQLRSTGELTTYITDILHATSWKEREKSLCNAYEYVAEIHNSLGITAPILAEVSQFHGRPFKIIQGEAIAKAIIEQIKDPEIASLEETYEDELDLCTRRRPIGNIDLISDNTDLLEGKTVPQVLRAHYTD